MRYSLKRATLLGIYACLVLGGVETASPAQPNADSIRGVFEEPLIPVGVSSLSERAELERALVAYKASGDAEPLETFLRVNPTSGWRASLLWGLSTAYREMGAHSKELEALSQAWTILRTASGSPSPLEDRVAGDLAEVMARYGKQVELRALLESLNGRFVVGSSSTKLEWARLALDGMTAHEGRNRICGPLALLSLAGIDWHRPEVRAWLKGISTSPEGTSLFENASYARGFGLELVPVRRIRNTLITAPMILHQKENHFVTVQTKDGDRYKIYDPAQGITRWITSSVLEEESTGYGLIPKELVTQNWEILDSAEANQIRGAAWCAPGPNPDDSHGPDSPTNDDDCKGGNGMPAYTFYLVEAGLGISDTPLAYTTPKGPRIEFGLTYNQRDANQPQTFTYTNWGPKWTSAWVSYLIPSQTSTAIKHYRAGGGQLTFAWIPIPTTGTAQPRVERLPDSGAVIYHPNGKQQTLDSKTVKAMKDQGKSLPGATNPRLAMQERVLTQSMGLVARPGDWIESRTNEFIRRSSGGGYVLYKPDGSSEIYDKSDGATPAKYFLSSRVDPSGNTVSITYDATMRITSVVDALGQISIFSYGDAGEPTRVTQITDPFGRTAKFSYNTQGLLQSITDAEGMTSSFGYGGTGSWAAYGGPAANTFPSDFISSMTTPYGTTAFNTYSGYEWLGIEAKDPLGFIERAEYRHGAPGMPYQELQSPPGVFNGELSHRNSFFWDKRLSAFAPTDYTQARIYHWLNGLGYEEVWPVLESEKKPLDSRIWYLYPDQPAANKQGSSAKPSSILRLLDDGSLQQTLNAYNSLGKLFRSKDPSGREMSYSYSADGVDLLEVRNITAGRNELLASYTYNAQHRPLTATDASGKVTTLTYNAAGQVNTIQNPNNETTTLSYDGKGYLMKVEGAVAGSATTFTYDTAGRVQTVTGPDAFTLLYDYDKLDRRTKVTYPDGTTDSTIFNRLDIGATVDRKGQWTYMTYNPIRQLVEVKDSQGRITRMDWCGCGQLEGLVDLMGRFTNWQRDLQGRVVAKIFPDLKSTKYSYDTSSRLVSRTDAKGQVTTYTYFVDGNLQQVAYSGGTTSTPGVSYTYDPAYNRLASMVDGNGTTNYSYFPVTPTPSLGAGRLATVSGPLTNSTITYGYDELGRVHTRDISGSLETRQFDALGRMISVTNPLGTFTYDFDGLTNRMKTVTYPSGQTTTFSYFDALGNRRLKQIANATSAGLNISTFDYTYDPNGQIQTWSQKADAQTPRVQSFTYDTVGQILGAQLTDGSPTGAVLKSYLYSYDESGNRLSEQIDGQLSISSFNSLNQLIGQRASSVNALVATPKGGVAKATKGRVGSTPSRRGLPQGKVPKAKVGSTDQAMR